MYILLKKCFILPDWRFNGNLLTSKSGFTPTRMQLLTLIIRVNNYVINIYNLIIMDIYILDQILDLNFNL